MTDPQLLLSMSSCSAISDLLAEHLKPNGKHLTTPARWLDAEAAADYLACPMSRIRKLTATGDLPVHRDGRRVLYDVAELDDFVRSGGGLT